MIREVSVSWRQNAMTCLRIDDYGIIGDLHRATLVGRKGSIAWREPARYSTRCWESEEGSEVSWRS
jgi:hypothetical protein